MGNHSQHEPFGILPWVVAVLSLAGLLAALYAQYLVAQGRVPP
ncbi:MAG TPA: hypothetical protein VIH17_02105 [Candidatus Acidoferrales bacterium]